MIDATPASFSVDIDGKLRVRSLPASLEHAAIQTTPKQHARLDVRTMSVLSQEWGEITRKRVVIRL